MLSIAFWMICSFAQDSIPFTRAQFERYTSQEGLFSNLILSMAQDHQGFIWVGAVGGLYRFDGHRFYHFESDTANHHDLHAMSIPFIYEDKHKDLWIGSTHNGLKLLDRKSGKFSHYLPDPENEHSINSREVIRMIEDSHGQFWIGTSDGLNLMDREAGTFTLYKPSVELRGNRRNFHIMTLDSANDGTLWAGTIGHGLFKFDPISKQFTKFPLPISQDDIGTTLRVRIRKVFEDKHGDLWIGTNAGLFRFDHRYDHIATYRKHDQPGSIAGSAVMDMIEDKDDQLWIATHFGLSRFNRTTNSFTNYLHDGDNPNSLSNDHIDNLMEDREGNIWIGTAGGGVNRFRPKEGSFTYYSQHHIFPSGSKLRATSTVASDGSGTVWLGGPEGYLASLDMRSHNLREVQIPLPDTELEFARTIMTVSPTTDDELWLGTTRLGLFRYDLKTKELDNLGRQIPSEFRVNGIVIRSVFQDKSNRTWIGTNGRGLLKYDKNTTVFSQYLVDEKNRHSISSNHPYYFAEDRNGHLWLGMNHGGVDRVDPHTMQFETYEYFAKSTGIRRGKAVNFIFSDSRGLIWIGSENGLVLYNEETNQFQRLLASDGLVDGDVTSVEEDQNGRLWFGTGRGIFRLDVSTMTFHRFDQSDGLKVNNFLWDCSTIDSITGQMVFGTRGGILIFQPESFQDNMEPPPMVISNLKYYLNDRSKSVSEDIWINNKESVTFPSNVDIIEVELAALNYHQSNKNHYSYKLERKSDFFAGQEGSSWFDLGTENSLRFTSLSPGDYELHVKGSNNDGIWSDRTVSLQMSIKSPWWRTWAAYFCYAFILATSLYLIRRNELNRRHLKQLAEIERARAEEKQSQAEQIEEQAAQLSQSLNDLKEKNEEILIAQNQLIQKEKLASLGQLTAGIAHEIKNPLNFVTNFAEGSIEILHELKAKIQGLSNSLPSSSHKPLLELIEELLQNSEDIKSNGNRADRIIHSMMDHARGSSTERRAIDVNQLIDDTINLAYHGYRSQESTFNVQIERKFDKNMPPLELYPQEFGRALLNLLNNAYDAVSVKLRRSSGSFQPVVTVSTRMIQPKTDLTAAKVQICIEDNGDGMSNEIRKKIFQPFYTTKPSGFGNTGLGLSISYDIIVNQHDGKLIVETKPNHFTKFTIEL